MGIEEMKRRLKMVQGDLDATLSLVGRSGDVGSAAAVLRDALHEEKRKLESDIVSASKTSALPWAVKNRRSGAFVTSGLSETIRLYASEDVARKNWSSSEYYFVPYPIPGADEQLKAVAEKNDELEIRIASMAKELDKAREALARQDADFSSRKLEKNRVLLTALDIANSKGGIKGYDALTERMYSAAAESLRALVYYAVPQGNPPYEWK